MFYFSIFFAILIKCGNNKTITHHCQIIIIKKVLPNELPNEGRMKKYTQRINLCENYTK